MLQFVCADDFARLCAWSCRQRPAVTWLLLARLVLSMLMCHEADADDAGFGSTCLLLFANMLAVTYFFASWGRASASKGGHG